MGGRGLRPQLRGRPDHGWAARRLGRQAIAAGTLAMAAGELAAVYLVPRVGTGSDTILQLAPALLVQGLGMGVAINSLASTILARVGPGRSGAAAGVLTTAQQLDNALGVAIIGTVFYSSLLSDGSYSRAFQLSLVFLLAVAVSVALLVQLLPRRVFTAPPADQVGTTPGDQVPAPA